jgi:peptidoglycan/LPS O-acetylase OafA/YrhL
VTRAAQKAPPAERRPSLDSLTGLRFLAAMAVVLSHFTETGLVQVDSWVVNALDSGRTAVSLFFVLSGFVLAYNYRELAGRVPRWNFYVARLARIYPVVLLGIAIGALGVVYAWTRPNLLLSWFALESADLGLLASLGAQLTMTTGWLPFAALNQPWNGPAWSISCEMFFYALFPLLIIWFRRWSRPTVAVAALTVWVAQGLWIAVLTHYVPANRGGFLIAQFPLTHLAEFVLGIAAWRLWSGNPIDRRIRGIALAGTMAGLVTIALWAPISPAYWPMTPLFALLVVLLAARGKARSWLALPVMLLLGEASYSLYLLHLPLVRVYEMVGVPPGPAGWVVMAATVLISVVVFTWYEAPLRRFIRRRLARPTPTAMTTREVAGS